MHSEFLVFTRRCFLSVSSASLAISKTDDVITENGSFFPLAGAPLKPMIALGQFCSNQAVFFFCFFYLPSPLPALPFITQMPRWRWLLTTPGSNGPARRSVTELLTGGWDFHLCFTCRPRLHPEDACKAIIVCALVDPVNNWLYWLSLMASAPRKDGEARRGGLNYSHFNYIKVPIVVWAGQWMTG